VHTAYGCVYPGQGVGSTSSEGYECQCNILCLCHRSWVCCGVGLGHLVLSYAFISRADERRALAELLKLVKLVIAYVSLFVKLIRRFKAKTFKLSKNLSACWIGS
jgi:hypothetical protein